MPRWDQSPLFKQIYEDEFGQLGGQPFGCLVGDYYFSHLPTDVQLLRDLSKIAGAAHAPFFAGADPTLMGMDSWTELSNPRDLEQGVRHAGICGLEGPARLRTIRAMSASACRACSRGCPMAPSPSRSRNSPSRKRPTATPARSTAG